MRKPEDVFHLQTNFDRVKEFNAAMGVEKSYRYVNRTLRWKLIQEELKELEMELFPFNQCDKKKLAKEIADLLYVVYGCADALDLPIDQVFAEVHKSNMTKLVDGKPVRREDGKVMKGPNYQPPDLSWVA